MHTLHAGLLGGRGDYLADKQQVLDGVQAFVQAQRQAEEATL